MERETVYLTAVVPRSLAEAFLRLAASDDRTVSAALRQLIRRHVDESARSGKEALVAEQRSVGRPPLPVKETRPSSSSAECLRSSKGRAAGC